MLSLEDIGQGTPLIMLHAVGTSGRLWQRHVPKLAKRFRVITPDLPGHGRSPKPKRTLSIEGMSEELFETLKKLNLNRFHCVGLSLGGMVAQRLALDHPEAVVSLTLCDTICEVDSQGAQIMVQRAKDIEDQGLTAQVQPTLNRWFTRDFSITHPDVVKEVEKILLAADPTVVAQTWRAIGELNLASRLTGLKIPVLIINGALDNSIPPGSGKRLAEILAARLIELPGCAHMSPLEAPDIFIDLLEKFVLNQK